MRNHTPTPSQTQSPAPHRATGTASGGVGMLGGGAMKVTDEVREMYDRLVLEGVGGVKGGRHVGTITNSYTNSYRSTPTLEQICGWGVAGGAASNPCNSKPCNPCWSDLSNISGPCWSDLSTSLNLSGIEQGKQPLQRTTEFVGFQGIYLDLSLSLWATGGTHRERDTHRGFEEDWR